MLFAATSCIRSNEGMQNLISLLLYCVGCLGVYKDSKNMAQHHMESEIQNERKTKILLADSTSNQGS